MSKQEGHGIRLVKRGVERDYVVLDLNGEEVRIDKVSNEEEKELLKPGEDGVRRLFCLINEGFISLKSMEVPMAVYRLLLFFGPPNGFPYGRYNVFFKLRYKNYIFKIADNFYSGYIDIHSAHPYPENKYHEYFAGKEPKTPENIVEEFKSLIEFLVRYPFEREYEWT